MLDSSDPNDANEPIENAESAEPTDPIDANDPTEPIESDEPVDAIEQNEFVDQSDHPVRRTSVIGTIMPVDERNRLQLAVAAKRVLGPDEGITPME